MAKSILKKLIFQSLAVISLLAIYFVVSNLNKKDVKPKDDIITIPSLQNIKQIEVSANDNGNDDSSNFNYAFISQDNNWVLKPIDLILGSSTTSENHEEDHKESDHASHFNTQNYQILANYLAKPVAKTIASYNTTNPDDLSNYGLDKPTRTITITNNTESQIFTLGNFSPSGDVAYFKASNSPVVYAIDEKVAKFLMNDIYFFANKILDSVDQTNLASIKINDLLMVKKTTPSLISVYQFASSIYNNFDVDQKNLLDIFLNTLDNFFTKQVEILEFSLTNLAKYNLVKPAISLTLTDSTNKTITINISNMQHANKTYYAYTPSENFIFGIDEDLYDRLANLNPFNLLNKFVALEFIDNIASIELTSDILSVQGEIINNKKQTYFINKKQVKEDEFKAYYQKFISIFYEGLLTDLTKNSLVNPMSITQKYSFKDGRVKTIVYTPYTENFYSVSIDGKASPFVVGTYQITNLLSALN